MVVASSPVTNSNSTPAAQNNPVSTWQGRACETGKEIALASLPFLTLYKPLSYPVALGTGGLRVGIAAIQLADAIKQGNQSEILAAFLQTTVSVISLAGTIFAHPLGVLISTGYDLINEVKNLAKHLQEGNHKEALQSCLKIVGHALYFAVFAYGGPELMIGFFAVQILTGLMEAHQEFAQGHYFAGIGHALMSILRGGQLAGQVRVLQSKQQLQQMIKSLSETAPQEAKKPPYVGKLGDKWQFPSDHLPVGAKVGNAHVISWNVLNNHFMSWVTENDSQGLNGSLITKLHELPSKNFPGLTMRDELVMSYLLQIMNNPAHNGQLILSLQECSPEFVRGFSQVLPSHMGMVLSDQTTSVIDQNIVLYNREAFTYLPDESSIVKAFPLSDPRRPLMDLVFLEKATQEKFQVINVHLPGDPNKPGTFEFAKYVLSHMKSGCNTIALGDMNFTEPEMQDAFNKAAAELGVASPLRNLSNYNTNISPFVYESKSIDHIWVNTKLKCETMTPDEVLPGLQKTVDLLHPEKARLEEIEVLRREQLNQWYKQQRNAQTANAIAV